MSPPRPKKVAQGIQQDTTAEKIVAAATNLFATKGYEGTSTKEICDTADVNIAAIHYHFGSKEQLYCEIIESFGGAKLRSMQRILEPPANFDEFKVRMKMYLEEAIEPFLQQPEVCKIVQTEIELLHARSEKVFRGTYMKSFETVVAFLAHAKKVGIIDSEIDPRFAARSLHSQICHQTRADNVYKKFFNVSLRQDAYRKTWIDQTLRMFLAGICTNRNV